MWDEITYPSLNFHGCNFIPPLTMEVITCPCLDHSKSILVKGATGVSACVLVVFVLFPTMLLIELYRLPLTRCRFYFAVYGCVRSEYVAKQYKYGIIYFIATIKTNTHIANRCLVKSIAISLLTVGGEKEHSDIRTCIDELLVIWIVFINENASWMDNCSHSFKRTDCNYQRNVSIFIENAKCNQMSL